MNAQRAAIATIVELLVAGEFDVIEAVTRGRRLSARDLQLAVGAYGRTLIPVPDPELEELSFIRVVGAQRPTYYAAVDLWSKEQGRSDLTLELWLLENDNGTYDTEVLDLHIM